ncbi:hypothetical protein C0992_005811 [Termitomyces sp. T32_za158]|nr:hypothetical protein C0992_005811 [Termitomyces sp. T32_za158]
MTPATLAALTVPRGLPVPVQLTGTDIWDADRLQQLIDEVKISCDTGLRHIVTNSSKLSLIRMRLAASDTDNISEFRHYLEITTPAYRKAFTKLVVSNHVLGIEVLRHTQRYRAQPLPRQWRLCRFCAQDVEDEVHALLLCDGHAELTQTRAAFKHVLHNIDPDLCALWGCIPPLDFLIALITSKRCATAFGRFTFEVFSIFDSELPYIPPTSVTSLVSGV